MKEMVYQKKTKQREILYSGKYKDYQFYIVSYQTYFEICCAINKAIKALKEREENA